MGGVFFFEGDCFCLFEVTVFILKSMFWTAAQNSAKMRAGARASRARQRGFLSSLEGWKALAHNYSRGFRTLAINSFRRQYFIWPDSRAVYSLEVSVFILRSMFWRAAQNSAKMEGFTCVIGGVFLLKSMVFC